MLVAKVTNGVAIFVGVYGDVTRVKILFNKKDSALVQMREPSQAQLGKTRWNFILFLLLVLCASASDGPSFLDSQFLVLRKRFRDCASASAGILKHKVNSRIM